MAANKFSSLLLFSLMVSTFILLPMASGQIRICPVRRPPCKVSQGCIQNCIKLGYMTGGCEEKYSSIYCCCIHKMESRDNNHHSPSAH
ncbi:unnamed protein product [Brassica oleracea var. botrytis]|uniref:Uncharacterized protein n=1 Tax=Brassica napus TaxID=3708 RepID=A0ABQ7XEM9_BRANA|nr:hypothetical protein HID58_073740 [Brassica napus]KAH0872427.1 hypothetical protein HID58_069789 [Brassica napus]